MPKLTAEDFVGIDQAQFDEIMATGYGPAGDPGTPDHALEVADALEFAGTESIYVDYEGDADWSGYPKAAAVHANISSLQSAASYAADVMKALAANPELHAQVQAAVAASRAAAPKL